MMAGLAIWRKLGDPHYIALGLNFLVPTLVRLGRYQEAKTFMQESIALCELTRNRWGMGTAYRFLGLAYLADGQCEEAQANLLKSLETFGEYYVGWDIVLTLNYLGDVALMTGDLSTAQKTYLDVLRSAVEAQATPIALDALLGLSRVRLQMGEPEQAYELAYHVLNHIAATQEAKDIACQVISEAEDQIDASQAQAIREESLHQPLTGIVQTLLSTSQADQDQAGDQTLASP